jgi:hypothetical protein
VVYDVANEEVKDMIRIIEKCKDLAFIIISALLLLGIISQPTFINFFVDIFKDAALVYIFRQMTKH